MAAENGDIEKATDLLDVEKHKDLTADIDAKGLDDWTSLHMASSEGHSSITELLLLHECEIDPKSSIGRTPLHIAALRGYHRIVVLLVKGADVNKLDASDNTPLHYASEFGSLECVMVLLESRADILIKNCNGFIPSDISDSTSIKRAFSEFALLEQTNILENDYARIEFHNVMLSNDRVSSI